jgi:hypothetical protein
MKIHWLPASLVIAVAFGLAVPEARKALGDEPHQPPVMETALVSSGEVWGCDCMAAASCCQQAGVRGHGACQTCGSQGKHLLGCIAPSDHCFDGFISPMTNPVYFEDPRTLTEARLIYLRHKVPLTVGGGDVNLVALQLRAALTDRLSIIATKDGYGTSSNAVIDDGWADINVGLKYNLLKSYEHQCIISGGVTYELPVGSTQFLQGNGDGVFNLFMTGGIELGRWHFVSAKGLLLPSDPNEESQLWYWSWHLDRRLGASNLYFLAESNWYSYIGSGENTLLSGVEGGDLFNFGSTDVTHNDIVTGAFGLKYKPGRNTELGVAWEAPLTERRDILDNRLYVDWILRY